MRTGILGSGGEVLYRKRDRAPIPARRASIADFDQNYALYVATSLKNFLYIIPMLVLIWYLRRRTGRAMQEQ